MTAGPGPGARTEADLLAALNGAFTLGELYDLVGACREVIERDAGLDVVHGRTDLRWRRRLRGVLAHRKRKGTAEHAGDHVWVLHGTPERPRTAVLVSLAGTRPELELRLETAIMTLRSLEDFADLIFADLPYGLRVGEGEAVDTGARAYARDGSRVVAGYVDVPADQYRAFTSEWIRAAAAAVRPGGYVVSVTGPQQAAWTQVAAEDAGLTYVNSISAGHPFPMRTSRRWAHAHWTVTVMCSGPLTSSRRVFNPPADQVSRRSGGPYPVDAWWPEEVGRADARPGDLRYSNSLPLRLVDRIAGSLTRQTTGDDADLMVELGIGGGTGALVAWRRRLRYIGCDVNPGAIAFTARRLARELGSSLASTAGPATGQLTLL